MGAKDYRKSRHCIVCGEFIGFSNSFRTKCRKCQIRISNKDRNERNRHIKSLKDCGCEECKKELAWIESLKGKKDGDLV